MLAYELGKKWWNMGLMTEAARRVIDFFLREVGFKRVYAYHAAKCSGGILEKVMYSIRADEYL